MPVPSSQKANLSSAPSLNPMSPPADLVKPSPPPEGSCVALGGLRVSIRFIMSSRLKEAMRKVNVNFMDVLVL
ncbi:hypothetical protein Tco_0311573 [Tanacetum coccineum]